MTSKLFGLTAFIFGVFLLWSSCDEPVVYYVEPFYTKGKDTVKLASGLNYIVVAAGSGKSAAIGKIITYHYSLYTVNSYPSTIETTVLVKTPRRDTLIIGALVKGFEEGVLYMKEGSKHRLLIPYKLGYGSDGKGSIPPYTNLIFDVELVKVED